MAKIEIEIVPVGWSRIAVRAKFHTKSGNFEGESILEGHSYRNEDEFRSSEHYDRLKEEAILDLKEMLLAFLKGRNQWGHGEKILRIKPRSPSSAR